MQLPWWKSVLLLVVLGLSVLYALPNLYGYDSAIQIASKDQAPIDNALIQHVHQALKKNHLAYLTIQHATHRGIRSLRVRFSHATDQLHAKKILQQQFGQQYSVAIQRATKTPSWLRAMGATPMKLGLDLSGGIHFLLAIDTHHLLKTRQHNDLQRMKQHLRNQHIRYADWQNHVAQHDTLTLFFRDAKTREKAEKSLEKTFQSYLFTEEQKQNRNLLRVQLKPTHVIQLVDYAVSQTITTLRQRVNALGISEAIVQRQGRENVSVDLPGIQDAAQAKDLLGKTATLRFHLVDLEHDAEKAFKTGVLPAGSQLQFYHKHPVLLTNKEVLSGHAITYASSVLRVGRPAVNIRLDNGREQRYFSKITATNIGRPLAVLYIETQRGPKGKPLYTQRIISIATIQSALGHNFDITNLSSMQYANQLALLLRSGALPAPVHIVEERNIGPSLGQDNIRKGILSLQIGTLLVFFFMLFYYRYVGVIADVALVMNMLLILAILSLLGATLTLPGIAGIVLTVGMAVDANVLINERIREELRKGRSMIQSIQAGYQQAFSTIVDANVTTLIVAAILYALGSGAVKGFAVTLMVGLLASMFTAVFLTRYCVDLTHQCGLKLQRKFFIGIP